MRFVVQFKIDEEWKDERPSDGAPYSYPTEMYAREIIQKQSIYSYPNRVEYRIRPTTPDEITTHLGDREIAERRERTPSFWRADVLERVRKKREGDES
tara:strand:+ start:1153 stop:1446 length:294 start_codon:yes stop_codon:yes gene_type:complete